MSLSLDNDCSIQDLAFQVLKLFGVKHFNIRPLPWIMSFMTWSSKTWTDLEIFFKTWQPQLWNLTLFQDLESQVLKCFFWQFHVLKSWQWLLYSRLGFPSLETFRGKAFQHYRPLPRIMSFMTWSSKTWTDLELFFQDLASTVMKSDTFSRLGIPSFEMFFLAIPCP